MASVPGLSRRKRIAFRCERSVIFTDAGRGPLAHRPGMPLWVITIVICSVIWVLGTIAVTMGAVWLNRHQPH